MRGDQRRRIKHQVNFITENVLLRWRAQIPELATVNVVALPLLVHSVEIKQVGER